MLNMDEIREIIKLIDQSSIDEFTYETSGATISMKKNENTVSQTPEKEVHKKVQSADTPSLVDIKPEIQEEPKEEQTEIKIDYDYEIVSPMVGTLYSAPSPEREAYVTVGSKVEKDSIVCIVEAMKLFNEIEAEVKGEIVEILVEDGELVEYGQPLFRVKTK
ncbi:acetyl-CoA carboxylase biotin carboxyl carrier protein [Virgibacillus alimentarius]|uniref:Biotin carboxyl carrier protein of acetyl-CoA carboxylase n=1 Tax=Virgibacillus alimentarius TaxID=698769 RepID=A0ABS4S6G1_9BACI|nr:MULTISPECIES: acetyl-CoA carboxylase biotin carboxyl carrier protein [Virgibacillus]MBP2256474.1 acetyl-CoA carboxylase biotin carboxyl carrier protein [Virgibacillus alimentarius]HLR66419.1 acetyl-CoA carboxylase biotin carboxyl carrier protein [Virgibacillus sp.]